MGIMKAFFVGLWVLSVLMNPPVDRPEEHRAGFLVEANGSIIPDNTMSLVVSPGEMVRFRVIGDAEAYYCLSKQGILRTRGLRRWDWRAPDRPGSYVVQLLRAASTIWSSVSRPIRDMPIWSAVWGGTAAPVRTGRSCMSIRGDTGRGGRGGCGRVKVWSYRGEKVTRIPERPERSERRRISRTQ